jgi:hypothetical protein
VVCREGRGSASVNQPSPQAFDLDHATDLLGGLPDTRVRAADERLESNLLRRCDAEPAERSVGRPAHDLSQRRGLRLSHALRHDALSDVPQPLAALALRDEHRALQGEKLDEPSEVAIVRPAGRFPGATCKGREIARGERPVSAELPDEPALRPGIVLEPELDAVIPGRTGFVSRIAAHRGPVERIVLGRHDRRRVLVELALVEQPLQLLDGVAPEPAPQDEQMIALDGARRVELEVADVPNHVEDRRSARRREQLPCDGHATCVC